MLSLFFLFFHLYICLYGNTYQFMENSFCGASLSAEELAEKGQYFPYWVTGTAASVHV